MLFPVDEVIIESAIEDENPDEIILYWYSFSGKYLQYEENFPHSDIEVVDEILKIVVTRTEFDIDLYSFDKFASKFDQLTIKLKAEQFYPGTNKHILLYQNGIKKIHFNRYKETKVIDDTTKHYITYIYDHINKKVKIEKEILEYNEPNYCKDFHIAYDANFVDYIEIKVEHEEIIKDPYKFFFM